MNKLFTHIIRYPVHRRYYFVVSNYCVISKHKGCIEVTAKLQSAEMDSHLKNTWNNNFAY